jgi:Arc/MetJ-type ribon-helix-helix transcriptional regulator
MLVARDVREEFCQDLRDYLAEALLRMRTHVVVRTGKLAKLRGEWWRRIRPYGVYLKQLLGEYKFARGIYILPREKAEDVYKNLDTLCETLKKKRHRKGGEIRKKRERSRIRREKMVQTSFHVPPNMFRDLDEAAKMLKRKRAEIVREAIQRMLERKVCIVLTPEEKNMLEELVQRGAYRNVGEAVYAAVIQLLTSIKF